MCCHTIQTTYPLEYHPKHPLGLSYYLHQNRWLTCYQYRSSKTPRWRLMTLVLSKRDHRHQTLIRTMIHEHRTGNSTSQKLPVDMIYCSAHPLKTMLQPVKIGIRMKENQLLPSGYSNDLRTMMRHMKHQNTQCYSWSLVIGTNRAVLTDPQCQNPCLCTSQTQHRILNQPNGSCNSTNVIQLYPGCTESELQLKLACRYRKLDLLVLAWNQREQFSLPRQDAICWSPKQDC